MLDEIAQLEACDLQYETQIEQNRIDVDTLAIADETATSHRSKFGPEPALAHELGLLLMLAQLVPEQLVPEQLVPGLLVPGLLVPGPALVLEPEPEPELAPELVLGHVHELELLAFDKH